MIFPNLNPKIATTIAALCVGGAVTDAIATEGGGGVYPNGVENYLMGAVPPPGTYLLLYGVDYTSTRLNDNNGNRAGPPDFRVDVSAIAPRFVWVTNEQLLGGQVVFQVVAPLVKVKVRAGGTTNTDSGLGDMTFGAGLAYHPSQNLHYAIALDLNAPTASYDQTKLANISRNYWNLEPLLGVSYVQRQGVNADVKVMYDFNAKNKATNYRSGQEFHADYALGYGLGNGWVVGIGGFVYKQTTDDKLNGAIVANNKGQAFAVGPSIKYDGRKGFFITAKWSQESRVRNRTEGSGFNVKMSVPF